MKYFKIVFYFLILSSCLLFLPLSCSKDSTKPETITISGTVTLEGQSDYSGVTVMLFKPVQIDTALTNLNLRYPDVGIEIN